MPISLNSPEGRAIWNQMHGEALREAVSANHFHFPVLMIQSAANGSLCAGVYRRAGLDCEPITAVEAPSGDFLPVLNLYIEMSTLRTAQCMFTAERWRKASQKWTREQWRAVVL